MTCSLGGRLPGGTPTLQDERGNGKGGSERTPPARARFVVPATYDVFEVVKDTGFLDTSLPLASAKVGVVTMQG